jgi:DNA-binding transcriptional regulator/RsmH inhibitor MraZ
MLLGEYEHTIDDKNRLTLPARFREAMADGVVVVVRHSTKTSELARLRRQLTTLGTAVAGYLLTFTPPATMSRRKRDAP